MLCYLTQYINKALENNLLLISSLIEQDSTQTNYLSIALSKIPHHLLKNSKRYLDHQRFCKYLRIADFFLSNFMNLYFYQSKQMSVIKAKLLLSKDHNFLNLQDPSMHRSQASFDQQQKSNNELKQLIHILKDFVSLNKNQAQKQNNFIDCFQYNDMEPRDRPIAIPMPLEETQITRPSLEKYITSLCTVVWSKAFHYYSTNQLSFQNTKIYCSQQILENITKLSQKYSLRTQDFQLINNHIKNNILEYMLNKYPMTLSQEINKNLNNSIRQIDNTDNTANNYLYRSSVTFKYRENAEYNDLIMRTINQAIKTIQSKHDNKTVYQKFQDKMMLLFESVTDYQWMNKVLQNQINDQSHSKPPSLGCSINLLKKQTLDDNIFKSQYIKIKEKQKSSYEEKVRQYTHYKIGKKLPDSTRQFTEEEINSHRLKIQSPQILRIMTKWCQQLSKKFDSTDYFQNFVSSFSLQKSTYLSMMRSQIKSNLSFLISEQKNKLTEQLSALAKNNYYMQSELLMRKLMSAQFNQIERYEQISALLSIDIVNNLHSYIIIYLNRLIHGILSVFRKFSKLPISQQLQCSSNQGLVTFQVMDLVRCKCSSKQKEILRIYNEIMKLCEQSNSMELVRVANRLKRGTNDIIINVKYRNVLCEIQLAITNKNNTFLEYSNNFNHYLYELKRSVFSPLTELCSIWKNLDSRFNVYSTLCFRQKQQKDISLHNCSDGAGFMIYNKPFICNTCNRHFYHNKFIKKHVKCKLCDFWMCAYCQLEKSDCTQLLGVAFHSDELNKKYKKLRKNQKKIPNYGFCIYIESQQVFVEPFRKYQNKQSTKIIGISNKNPYQIFDVSTQKQAEKFLSKFLVFEVEQQYGKNHIKINDDLVIKYLTTEKYKHILSKNKDTVNLNSQKLNNADLETLFSIGKQHERDRIKCVQLIDNNLTSFEAIAQSFQNATKIEVSKNNIKSFASLKTLHKLQKVNLNDNGIKQFPQQICQIQTLKQISINQNQIKLLPPSLNRCSQLTSLHISSNKLSQIPSFVFQLRNLSNLNMTSNFIKQIPKSVCSARKLKFLSLQNNYLKEIPQEIQCLGQLQHLNLSHNKIQQIPSLFLPSLKHLNLRHNNIDNVNTFMQTKLNVKQIDLSYNKISSIQKVESFSQLKFLNLNHNEITNCPIFGQSCSNLKHLLMSNNKLTKMVSFWSLVNLQELQLNENLFEQIHPSLLTLPKLYILHLQRNCLKRIIGIQSQSLIKLYLNRNKIAQFQCTHMKNLQEIDLSQNQLKTFEQNIFPKLRKINLNINQLQKLDLSTYHRLSSVNATRNKLPNFPALHDHNQIKVLNLEHNSIVQIPHTLNCSISLKNLNLSGNKIKVVPHTLQHLNLDQKSLFLQNNPIQIVQCFNYIMAKCGHHFIKQLQAKLIRGSNKQELLVSQTHPISQ